MCDIDYVINYTLMFYVSKDDMLNTYCFYLFFYVKKEM